MRTSKLEAKEADAISGLIGNCFVDNTSETLAFPEHMLAMSLSSHLENFGMHAHALTDAFLKG